MHNKTIPNDWVHCSLGDAITHVVGGGTPSRAVPVYWDGNIPWASVKDFSDDTQRLDDTEEHISSIGLASSAANLIEAGTPIVCTRMAVGRSALAVIAIAINQDLKALYPQNYLDAKYLLLLLNFIRPQLESLSIGSTVKGITVDQLLKLPVSFPGVSEQHRIVEIMATIDEMIALTSSLIAKLKQIKAGLLHDLLTRGLDENGELRDAIAHPEQFKDSALGQIPKDWEVFKLSEVVPRAEYGISLSLEDEVGIPVLRMNNLKNGEVDLTDLKKSRSTQAINLLLQGFDILFNRTNSIEHVGRTAIWRGQISHASFASYLVRLVPDTSKLIHEYLNIWLNLSSTQLLIRHYATPGVHQVNINPTNLRKVLIALPKKVSEQKQIVEKITVFDTRIRAEEIYCDKLKQQKKGLMYDLLTGRVRLC